MKAPQKYLEDTVILLHADALLAQMAETTRQLAELEEAAKREIDEVRSRHAAAMAPLAGEIAALDKGIKAYARKHQVAIFDGRDRVDLKAGALIHTSELKIKRTKGLLERLEALGETDAIRIVKSVDFGALKNWTDERLFAAGTERRREELYSYELREETK